MSSASSAITYTSVYTDSAPDRVFWESDEEVSDGGTPRVIIYGYDGLPMQPVAPPSPDYVPGPEHPPCNTPKMGRSGIRIRGMLLQDQQHKIYIRTTQKSFKLIHWI
ncbi:hypothetical protein Tco_0622586, partial [Tanacetum coccineum]